MVCVAFVQIFLYFRVKYGDIDIILPPTVVQVPLWCSATSLMIYLLVKYTVVFLVASALLSWPFV